MHRSNRILGVVSLLDEILLEGAEHGLGLRLFLATKPKGRASRKHYRIIELFSSIMLEQELSCCRHKSNELACITKWIII